MPGRRKHRSAESGAQVAQAPLFFIKKPPAILCDRGLSTSPLFPSNLLHALERLCDPLGSNLVSADERF